MANVRDYIRINPIDQQENRAIGVRFPFNADAVFFSTYTTAEQVKSNLLSIVLTEPGERIFRPNFGVGLRNYLFENFIDQEDLKIRIEEQVNRYLPQINLLRVTVNKSLDSHELNVEIFYSLKVNQEEDAIQINFSQDSNINDSGTSSPSTGGATTTGGTSLGGGTSSGGGY